MKSEVIVYSSRGKEKKVLVYYLPPDFGGDEKPKGDPWKSKKFLLRGVDERGWSGVI